MAEDTGKLARWRLRISDFDFDIIHRAGVKHQAADALSRLNTKGEDHTPLGDKVPVLTITPETFAHAPSTGEPDFETVKEGRASFTPYLPKVCTLAGIADNQEAEVPTLAEFTTAQSTDPDCCVAIPSVIKPNSRFNVDSDGVLVRVSPLDGASQRYEPATLRARFLRLCHHSLLAGHPGERGMYDSMR